MSERKWTHSGSGEHTSHRRRTIEYTPPQWWTSGGWNKAPEELSGSVSLDEYHGLIPRTQISLSLSGNGDSYHLFRDAVAKLLDELDAIIAEARSEQTV